MKCGVLRQLPLVPMWSSSQHLHIFSSDLLFRSIYEKSSQRFLPSVPRSANYLLLRHIFRVHQHLHKYYITLLYSRPLPSSDTKCRHHIFTIDCQLVHFPLLCPFHFSVSVHFACRLQAESQSLSSCSSFTLYRMRVLSSAYICSSFFTADKVVLDKIQIQIRYTQLFFYPRFKP